MTKWRFLSPEPVPATLVLPLLSSGRSIQAPAQTPAQTKYLRVLDHSLFLIIHIKTISKSHRSSNKIYF